MAYHLAMHAQDTGDRIYFVGGDWHVQTGLATPDLAAHWNSDLADYVLVTTTPRAGFETLRTAVFEGRAYADYILIYE